MTVKKTDKNKLVGIMSIAIISVYLFMPDLQRTVNDIFRLFSNLEIDGIKTYILSFGIWAPIISLLLMVFQSIAAPLPAFLIAFANAAVFGWVKGAMLSWTGAMLGAALCFGIGQFLGRDVVVKLTSKFALEKVDEFFNNYGNYAILIARLLPFMSFDIVSYGAGLTSIGFWSFFWATGLGQLPATLIYSYAGEFLIGDMKMIIFGMMMLFSLTVLVALIKRMTTNKEKSK